jgi:hypothetical protein
MPWRTLLPPLAALSALLLSGCTSVDASVVAPAASKCQISLSQPAASFGPEGGTGSIDITTSRDCTWSIASEMSWVSINGAQNRQGEATVSYNVAANPVPFPRVGGITIAQQHVQVNQAAAPCRFELNRLQDTVGAAGGTLAVAVTTLTGCQWSAASNVPWIVVSSGGTAAASATVALTVSANSGTERVGTVNVAGQTYTVTQARVAATVPSPPADPSPPPTEPPAPPSDPSPPPPSPTPGVGQSVSFTGTITDLSGKCPNLTFNAGGFGVATNRDTRFKDLSCSGVRVGRAVDIEGTTTADGSVLATRVAAH